MERLIGSFIFIAGAVALATILVIAPAATEAEDTIAREVCWVIVVLFLLGGLDALQKFYGD